MRVHRIRSGGISDATAGAALLAALVLLGSSAHAADLTGKKLLLRGNPPRMVLLSNDTLTVPGAAGSLADPRCAPTGSNIGGSVKLDDGTHSATLSMPCFKWSANAAGGRYKYRDLGGTPKIGKLKAGYLKILSSGTGGFPVPNGAATVDVEVAVGADTYCMSFSGTGDGSKFEVRDAPTGTCPPPRCSIYGEDPTCSNVSSIPNCQACCFSDFTCGLYCAIGCTDGNCAAAINDAGCAAECCF